MTVKEAAAKMGISVSWTRSLARHIGGFRHTAARTIHGRPYYYRDVTEAELKAMEEVRHRLRYAQADRAAIQARRMTEMMKGRKRKRDPEEWRRCALKASQAAAAKYHRLWDWLDRD